MRFFSLLLKIFFIFLSLFNQAFAYYPEYDSGNLIITIQNLGSGNCQLIESSISQGKLYKHSNLPRVLEATGEVYTFILQGMPTEARVKYQCDFYKSFEIYMKQFHKKGHWHSSTTATMLNADNVFEKHKVTDGYRICYSDPSGTDCDSKAGEIHWQITH